MRKVKEEDMVQDKNTWKSSVGYVWAMIGSAVGFANILSFSAKCYYNGGAVFLIPLLVAFVTLGVPLLILEGLIGQYFQLPLIAAYRKVAGKKGAFLGWLSILAVITIGSYYIVLTGWSIAYAYFAATAQIGLNTASFFSETFLKDSGSLLSFGNFGAGIFLFTCIASLFTWFVTVRDIQSGIEKICSLFMPLLFLLVVGFATFVLFLPGASIGFWHYFVPDFSKLADARVWLASFGQAFFSLSLALGIVVGYSRHTDTSVHIARSMMLVALGDLTISLLSGLAIFGCIGSMSYLKQIPFGDVVTPSTFGLGFVVFPQILHLFNPVVALIIGPLFFFALFIAGITGVFSIVESIAGNFEVEFSWDRKRAISVTIMVICALSVFFCWGNAIYLMDALEPMTAGFNMIIAGLAEIFVFLYMTPPLRNHKEWFLSSKKRSFFYYSLRYLVPVMLVIILASSLASEFKDGCGAAEIIRWVWFVAASCCAYFFAYRESNYNLETGKS